MRIDPPQEGKKNKNSAFLILALALIAVCAGLSAYYYIQIRNYSYAPMNYQIGYFYGDVQYYPAEEKVWRALRPEDELSLNDKVRIGNKGEIEFGFNDQLKYRVKADSEFQIVKPPFYVKKPVQQIRLIKGVIFGAVKRDYKGDPVVFELSQHKTRVFFDHLSTFILRVDLAAVKSWVGVMRGRAELVSPVIKKGYEVLSLHKVILEGQNEPGNAQPVDREEWNEMKEVYELTQKSAATEALQHDLSKEAGNFFRYVIDHGTFYAPNVGRSERDFFRNEDSGEVNLELSYDVFPENSFVGMYVKTRGLNLSGFHGLRFDAKRLVGEGYPERVRVELKARGNLLRSFGITRLDNDWHNYVFPFNVKKDTELDELNFVFANDRVGQFKKGVFLIRRVELIPLDENVPEAATVKKSEGAF